MDSSDEASSLESDSRGGEADPLRWYQQANNWIRISIVVVLFTFIVFALCHPTFSVDLLTFFLEWIEANPWDGSLVFIGAYILCNVLMIPGIILSLGAGIIYSQCIGFWYGVCFATIVLAIASFLGSCVAFLNARFLLRNAVVYLLGNHKKLKLIDEAVKSNGFKVVFLFRLSPVTPYAIFNYMMGFSSVSFKDYCLGSIGSLPNVFAFAYLGASISNIYELSTVSPDNSQSMLVMTVVGAVMLMLIVCYFAWMARKELRCIAKRVRLENMNCLTADIENAPFAAAQDADGFVSDDDLM